MSITETRTLPPEFVEAAQKTFLTDLTRQAGIPSITTAIQQQPGETAQQFAQRQAQAQQFQITKAGMAELAPQVAAQDPLQAAAYAQAVDPTRGLGSFQPFLTKAGTAADAATALTGTGAGTGAGSVASYMSPFQQQVIDTTLQEFDKQRQIQQNQQAAAALGTPGAFGGGREGVMRAEFQAASDLNRAKILADLQQRGFQQAQQARQQDLSNQMGIAQLQSGLGGAAQQFAQRQAQAQQFQITKAGMAELAPQVAAQDPLQAAAYAQAVDPTRGLGSFQPFLTKAGTAADAATALTGTGAGTGAGSVASYMSPFQQQVIDTTLQEFDKQRQIQQNQQAAAALGTPGAFGGGREGVMRAEFQAASDLNRAKILADLQQRGFQQAQQARQQDLSNQMGISQLQSGLGAAAQDFSRAQISGLGTLGAQQQAQNQAILDAQRQAAQMAVQDPGRRLGMLGQGIAALTPGAGKVMLDPTPAEAGGASPLMQALGVGLAGADIYGRIFGGRRS